MFDRKSKGVLTLLCNQKISRGRVLELVSYREINILLKCRIYDFWEGMGNTESQNQSVQCIFNVN